MLVGSGAGGIDVAERQYYEFFTDGWKRVTPYAIPVSIVGMISSEISIALELHGISHVRVDRLHELDRCDCVRGVADSRGEAEVILSGGADACVTPGMIFGFSKMSVVATRYNDQPDSASRPFDRGRDGFVLGEGAWMVVLEREDRARARGARVYATIDGYGSTCDAYHRVQMHPDGEQIVRAMRLAIERSGHAIEEIGYVNFHGTSTVLNDAVESRCVRQVFQSHADRMAGLVDQVDDRPSAGRERRGGHRDVCAGVVARLPAADHQSVDARSGLRPRLHSQHGPRHRRRGRALQLSWIRIQEQRDRHRQSLTRSREDAQRVSHAAARVRRARERACRGTAEVPRSFGCRNRRRRPCRGNSGAGTRARRRPRQALRSRALSTSQAVRRHRQPWRARASASVSASLTPPGALPSTAC